MMNTLVLVSTNDLLIQSIRNIEPSIEPRKAKTPDHV
jgi:hypothetical protein